MLKRSIFLLFLCFGEKFSPKPLLLKQFVIVTFIARRCGKPMQLLLFSLMSAVRQHCLTLHSSIKVFTCK